MTFMDLSKVRNLPEGKYFYQSEPGSIRLTVLNSNPLYNKKFIVNCFAINLYQKELEATDPEEAKAEAVRVVKGILQRYIKELEIHE